MTPHLVKWHERYSSHGLTIIEVEDGSVDPFPAVQAHVAGRRLPFPVLYDQNGGVGETYGIQAYPTAYLIGRDGKVVWEGNPVANPGGMEKAIQQALKK